jgi:hypothetical protein
MLFLRLLRYGALCGGAQLIQVRLTFNVVYLFGYQVVVL